MAKAEKKRASGKKSLTQRIMNRASATPESEEKARIAERNNDQRIQKKLRNIPAPTIRDAKSRGFDNDDYYSVIDQMDYRKLGEISKNAYLMNELNKQDARSGRGGK